MRSRSGRRLLPGTTALRILNGEGDRMPGVVVDRYGDVLVCQLLTAGAAALAPSLFDALRDRLAPRTIYERSEGAVRREEGLADATGLRFGDEAARAARDRRGRHDVPRRRGRRAEDRLLPRSARSAPARAWARARSPAS
jgi:hypothetical protein